jgi:hypothetical protein
MSDTEPSGIQYRFIFSVVPEWVTDHPDLSDGAVRCYNVLARYANANHEIWPGQAGIAKRMNKSERAVRRYFVELTEIGALTLVKRRFDSSSIYVLEQFPPSVENRPDKNGRSVVEVGSDRTKMAAQTGQNWPPNESQEPERDKEPKPTLRVGREEIIQNQHCTDCDAEAGEPCSRVDGTPRTQVHKARQLAAQSQTKHSSKLTPRQRGENPRALGSNPKAVQATETRLNNVRSHIRNLIQAMPPEEVRTEIVRHYEGDLEATVAALDQLEALTPS